MAADLHKFLFKSKFMRKNCFRLWSIFIINLILCTLLIHATDKCEEVCRNGKCFKDKCVCDPGFAGENCQFCSGRIRLWNNTGIISDGVGNYSEDNQCMWLIDTDEPNASVRIYLNHFATECSWDHLYVYDGGSIYDPLLAVFSGMVVQDAYRISKTPEIIAPSGRALLHFYSDAAYNLTGFSISYKVGGCPSSSSKENCSANGACIDKCTCNAGWTGTSCSIEVCPNNCSSNGKCLMEQHRCVCHDGFTGNSCNQIMADGWWESAPPFNASWSSSENLNDMATFTHLKRASHAIVETEGVAWVIGGYSLTSAPHSSELTYDIPFLVLYNMSDNSVAEIKPKSKIYPSPRYGHSAVLHKDSIYMYGGTLADGRQTAEVWKLTHQRLLWEEVTNLNFPEDKPPAPSATSSSTEASRRRNRFSRSDKLAAHPQSLEAGHVEKLEDKKEFKDDARCSNSLYRLCSPFASVGHAAVVVRHQFMLVLLGYSSRHGSLNIVQEYYFDSNVWKVVQTNGAIVDGSYAHSAVWDPQSLLVYVHGGLKPVYSNSVSADLLTYDPFSHTWALKKPAPVPRFLHSSSLLPGLVLVFGGNTHNDTAYSYGAQCYSAGLLAYDIKCDTWQRLPDPSDIGVETARYGHATFDWRGGVMVVGGFNGQMLGSVLRYNPGRCEALASKSKCLTSYPGRKCVWSRVLERCEAYDPSVHWKMVYDICPSVTSKVAATNNTSLCTRLTSCSSCLFNSFNCTWCENNCTFGKCTKKRKAIVNGEKCDDRSMMVCRSIKTCELCNAHRPLCQWVNKECAYVTNGTVVGLGNAHIPSVDPGSISNPIVEKLLDLLKPPNKSTHVANNTAMVSAVNSPACPLACIQRSSCFNCTQGPCMWCFSQERCVSNNSYLVNFPYGQCREWTTESRRCVHQEKGLSKCMAHQTCKRCQGDIGCGWCADQSGTGTGVCLEGGQLGPVDPVTREAHYRRCRRDGWFFTDCPDCSCNGHSRCVNSSICAQPCANQTEGVNCERCKDSFHGNAINGGICKPCQCNGHGDACEHDSGKCHCNTKGVTGVRCDRCDTQNNYYGAPKQGGSCFYDLQIDYQFTFNLSKQEDLHIRQINFYNIPTKKDVDTDFDIQCSKLVDIMISAKEVGQPEVLVVQNFTGTSIRRRFTATDYVFGNQDNNTTFHVYVSGFVPPIEIVISFSQHPKLDLIQFFSIFSVCFMVLLFLAFVMWKVKQRYDIYTRRQRFIEEMEAMASRPFQSIYMELPRRDSKGGAPSGLRKDPHAGGREDSKGQADRDKDTMVVLPKLKKAKNISNGSKKGNACNGFVAGMHPSVLLHHVDHSVVGSEEIYPSPVALEPCVGNRAAVISLIVQLPNGGALYTPKGHPGGLAIASALVSLGTPRKQSADPPSMQPQPPLPLSKDIIRMKESRPKRGAHQEATCI